MAHHLTALMVGRRKAGVLPSRHHTSLAVHRQGLITSVQASADGKYLGAEVGLSGLRAVELQTLPNTLPEHVQGRVGFHDLGHGLRDEGLHPSEPVPK